MTQCLPKHSLNQQIYFSFAPIQEVTLSTSMDSIPKAALLFKIAAKAPTSEE